jgi:hypothetical protein
MNVPLRCGEGNCLPYLGSATVCLNPHVGKLLSHPSSRHPEVATGTPPIKPPIDANLLDQIDGALTPPKP